MSRALKTRLRKLETELERRHPPRYETKAERDARWAAWLDSHPYWHDLTPDEQNLGIHLHFHGAFFSALKQAHVDAAEHYARTGERPTILNEIPHILGRASA